MQILMQAVLYMHKLKATPCMFMVMNNTSSTSKIDRLKQYWIMSRIICNTASIVAHVLLFTNRWINKMTPRLHQVLVSYSKQTWIHHLCVITSLTGKIISITEQCRVPKFHDLEKKIRRLFQLKTLKPIWPVRRYQVPMVISTAAQDLDFFRQLGQSPGSVKDLGPGGD